MREIGVDLAAAGGWWAICYFLILLGLCVYLAGEALAGTVHLWILARRVDPNLLVPLISSYLILSLLGWAVWFKMELMR